MIDLPVLLLALDLIGVLVFGLSGGVLAVRHRLDVFGVFVLALATALAGGMLRDLLIGAVPPATLADPRYLVVALAAGAIAFFFHRAIEKLRRPVLVLDALGLGLFAVAGSQKALAAGLHWLPAILLGGLTAIGGGVVRDMLVREVPRVLREEIYALAALLSASVIVACDAAGLRGLGPAAAAVLAGVALRLLALWRGWHPPRAPGTGEPG